MSFQLGMLEKPEIMDVLITGRGPLALSGHRMWNYIVWGSEYPPNNRLRKYSSLCTGFGLYLYAGERTQVEGTSKVYAPAYGWRLIVECAQNRQFALKRMDRIKLDNPERGDRPRTTFSDRIISIIEGHDVVLRVPAILHRVELEDYANGTEVVVESVTPPYGRGYLIHAIPI